MAERRRKGGESGCRRRVHVSQVGHGGKRVEEGEEEEGEEEDGEGEGEEEEVEEARRESGAARPGTREL